MMLLPWVQPSTCLQRLRSERTQTETLCIGCFCGLFWGGVLLDSSVDWFLLFLRGVSGWFEIAHVILSSCVGRKITSLHQGLP